MVAVTSRPIGPTSRDGLVARRSFSKSSRIAARRISHTRRISDLHNFSICVHLKSNDWDHLHCIRAGPMTATITRRFPSCRIWHEEEIYQGDKQGFRTRITRMANLRCGITAVLGIELRSLVARADTGRDMCFWVSLSAQWLIFFVRPSLRRSLAALLAPIFGCSEHSETG